MVNRWADRAESGPGHGTLYWHILLGDQPQVRALASIGRGKLAKFSGLHFTPQRWLHITTLLIGPAECFTPSNIADMTRQAQQLLSRIPPIKITLRKIIYHSEAIVLRVEPENVLDPLRDAVWNASQIVKRGDESAGGGHWIPHVTLAYSTSIQPANPIIAALGRELPACEATINAVTLVCQDGAERLWDWHCLEKVAAGISGRK
jgi:2'-5' RNA ligase